MDDEIAAMFANIAFSIFIIALVVLAAFMILSNYNEVVGGETESHLATESVLYSSSEPRVSQTQIERYLEAKGHPDVKGMGSVFYSLGVKYDIDPAFAVAVAQIETNLGKATCTTISRDCNNIFCIKSKAETVECRLFQDYTSYSESIEAFYELIKYDYVPNGQDTISEIGCAPGSGYSSHCYCVNNKNTPPYCDNWIDANEGVPAITAMIRGYET